MKYIEQKYFKNTYMTFELDAILESSHPDLHSLRVQLTMTNSLLVTYEQCVKMQ